MEGYPGEYMEVSTISQWNVLLCVQNREAGGCAAGSYGIGFCSCFGYALEILHVLRVLGYARSPSEQLLSEKQRRGNVDSYKGEAMAVRKDAVPRFRIRSFRYTM